MRSRVLSWRRGATPPRATDRAQNGDIVNVDITVYLDGFHGDNSEMFLVGEVDEGGQRLVRVARECRDIGIAVCRPGAEYVSQAEKGYTSLPSPLTLSPDGPFTLQL